MSAVLAPEIAFHLKQFQDEAKVTMVNRFVNRGIPYHLLAGDTGLGKTATAIRTAEVIWRHVSDNNPTTSPIILVITDAAVKFNWVDEIFRWSSVTLDPQDVWVVDGSELDRMVQMGVIAHRRPKWVITNPDTIRLELPLFQDLFADPDNNLIILDEADRIQNMDSLRSVAIRSLEAAWKLAMTATPVANRADTLYPILQFLNPGKVKYHPRKWGKLGTIPVRYHESSPFWGKEEDYLTQYCTFNDYGQVNGSKNLPDLHRRLQEFGITRWLKRELADLPPIIYDTRIIDGTPGENEWYNRLVDGFIDYMDNGGKAAWSATRDDPMAHSVEINNILAQLNYLRVGATVPPALQWQGFMQRNFPKFEIDAHGITLETHSSKADWVKEYIETELGEYGDLPEYGGMFVWSQWTTMTEHIYRTLSPLRGRTGMLKMDGSDSGERRFAIQQAVQSGACKVLISSPAGGRGANFQRLDTAILTDLPWSPNVVDQAVGRVDRIGQQADVVTIVTVLRRNTIDTKRMLKVLQQKQSDNNEILDGKRGGKSKSVLDFKDPEEIRDWV